MSRAGLVDYYLEKSKQEGFEIDQVRKELESKEVPEKEIRVIVKLVDSEIQKRALIKTSRNKSREFVVIGAALTIIGAGITIGTYTGIIPSGNSYLIVYGPLIVGISLLLGGWMESKKT